MRIAYVSTLRNDPWGGSEELWYRSAQMALRQSHKVSLSIYSWDKEPRQIQELRSNGAFVYKRRRGFFLGRGIIERICAMAGWHYPSFMNPYRSLCRFKPDVIVVTDGGTYYAADDKWLHYSLSRFKKKYIIICQANSPYRLPASRQSAARLFADSKLIVFVSKNNRDLAFHQLAFSDFRTAVVQNPVNLDSLELLQLPRFENGIIHCAVVGRFCVADKGQDLLVRLMADDYWRNSSVVVHLFGAGNDRQYLQDLVAYYDVGAKVIIERYQTPNDIWTKCHCLIMSSISEGTPLTLLEAMAVGRICIATDVGGISEWIEDGVNGYLIKAPVIESLSEKMKEAISNIDRWPEISMTAHNDFIRRFDEFPGRTLLGYITNED